MTVQRARARLQAAERAAEKARAAVIRAETRLADAKDAYQVAVRGEED